MVGQPISPERSAPTA